MEDMKNEFITKHRENKPPYTLSTRADGTKIITIDRRRKITPAYKEIIEMLVKVGYIPSTKKTDITKADMIKYVKENYDQEELELLNEQFESINSTNEENDKMITFATVKSWFKNRYIYYPKGQNFNFGRTTKAQEKKERFLKVFNEHKQELRNADKGTQEIQNATHEDKNQEQPQ